MSLISAALPQESTQATQGLDGPATKRFFVYPDLTGKRLAEGGLRTHARVKRSLPDMPLVSIITVCLNSAATLEQCMRSVFAQTYQNVEYIIIDGGSNDGTVDTIKRYADAIDYFVSEPDAGLYQAMNKGLALASGEHILILNSDDWYTNDAVAKLIRAKKESGADFVSALATIVDEKGKKERSQRSMPFDESVRLRMPLRHETMLIPSEIYNRLGGYDESFRIIADFLLSIRLFESKCTHYEIPEPLMFFRNTGVSSVGIQKLVVERARLLSNKFPCLTPQEVDILAEHGRLMPDTLRELINAHSKEEALMSTLRCFVLDQKAARSKKWLDFDMGAFAQTQAAGADTKAQVQGPLRVATFISRDSGGAATGSHRRVTALRKHGIDARIHSLVASTKRSHVYKVPPGALSDKANASRDVWDVVREIAIKPVRETSGFCASEMFSLHHSVLDFRKASDIFNKADVVHLHWVVGMFDYAQAGELLADKPMVWTLADMNPFTGGCHYSEGCEEFKRECRSCPLLGGSDLAHESWKAKKAAYSKLNNLQIICPSRWMAALARSSSLFGDKPVHYIPNAFPTEVFTPTNKMVARVRLGLPLKKRLVLFGAENLNAPRKGGGILVKAIELMHKRGELQDTEVIVFGKNALNLPVRVHSLGSIEDDALLAVVYSAADAFLFPSMEDNAPLTVGESLLCGTPVVAFPVGNVPDLVKDRKTGYIARHLDVEDFAAGIKWALTGDRAAMLRRSLDCRISAASIHNAPTAAQRHLAVYQRALAVSNTGASPQSEHLLATSLKESGVQA